MFCCNNSNSSTFNAFQNNNEDFPMFNFHNNTNNTDYNNEGTNHRSFTFSTPVYNHSMPLPYNNGVNYGPHTRKFTNNPNDYFSNYKNNIQVMSGRRRSVHMERNYSISEKYFNINNDNIKKSGQGPGGGATHGSLGGLGNNTFNKIFSGKAGWFCSECKNFNFESILI